MADAIAKRVSTAGGVEDQDAPRRRVEISWASPFCVGADQADEAPTGPKILAPAKR